MVDVGLLEMSVLVVVVVAEVIAVVVAASTIAVEETFVATVHSVVEEVVVDSKEWPVLLGTDVVPVVIAIFVTIVIVVLVTVIVVSVIRVFVTRNAILESRTVIATWNVDQALAVAIDHLVIVR